MSRDPKRATPELLRRFGARVRACRLERGWSQEELANASGLDRSYVGGVERGERNVSLINIARIARALGVTVQYLVDEIDSDE